MTILGIELTMTIFWLILAVVLLAIEAATVGLVTIWFAAGAVAAWILAMFNAPVTMQFVVFLLGSACLLMFTRKIFVEKLKTGSEATNVDALIGEIGQVIVTIEPHEVGHVRLKGQEWSAISKNDEKIEKDSLVKVISIKGVKLIVVPVVEK